MRLYTPLTLAVPASTPASSPVSAVWPLYPSWVHTFRIEIPSGHRGLTGVRLLRDGTPIIPFSTTDWLIGDNRTYVISYEDEVADADISVQGYNTDVWPHSVHLYADVNPYLPASTPAGIISPRSSPPALAAFEQIAGLAYAGGTG